MTYVILILAAAAMSFILTPIACSAARRLDVVDRPGPRKIHTRPVPRLGGVSVAISGALALSGVGAANLALGGTPVIDFAAVAPLAAGGLLVFGIGLWDDLRSASPWPKVFVQIFAAAVVAALGVVVERVTFLGIVYPLGALAVPATIVWIVGLTNAFNLIDGLDGLAAGLAIIAATTCATILLIRGHVQETMILAALIGATIGFLPYNFAPASIFLGDSGSLLLGFVLAVTAVTGWQKGATALAVAVPFLIFALPIADTCTAILRRATAPHVKPRRVGLARVFAADQLHIHHRLLALGLSQRNAVLLLYGLALTLSMVALISSELPW